MHDHAYVQVCHCSLILYLNPLPPFRKEEGAVVPVPFRDAPDTVDAKLHLVGAVRRWHVSVFLPEQGAPGSAVGPSEGKSQDHDLPENGPGAQELLPHRRD